MFRRRLGSALAAVGLAGTALVGVTATAAPAQAAPYGCQIEEYWTANGWFVEGRCFQGSGAYRVVGNCAWGGTAYGFYASGGNSSWANCGFGGIKGRWMEDGSRNRVG